MMTIYDYSCVLLTGQPKSLADYKGSVVLIVNTASKCGFTPQFAGMESLYQDFKNKGFELLGFPCNQFGGQDPGSNEDIGEFCKLNYGVSFPMCAKIEVNGKNTAPLYKYLKAQKPGILGSGHIKWNFTKFLVNRSGQVVQRFAPMSKPEDLRKHIEALL